MSPTEPRPTADLGPHVERLTAALAEAFAAPKPGQALRDAIAKGAVAPDSPIQIRALVYQITRLVERGDALLQARTDDILVLQQQADLARSLAVIQTQAVPAHGLGRLSPAELLDALPPADRSAIAVAQLEDARTRARRAEDKLRIAEISLRWRVTQALRKGRALIRRR